TPQDPQTPQEPLNPADPIYPQEPTEPIKPQEPDEQVEPVNLTVIKKWDDNGKDRPNFAKVTLYDGDTAVESVRLGDWNNWSYSWKGLKGSGNWQIVEEDIPKGYVPSYTYVDGVVTVVNTAALIQTGQLSWPIPVMGGMGLVLMLYGFAVILKKGKNEDV
ncbi:MAG: Cna B-type domain-containing protein, partial [Peptoniphilus sp.]|nr:Cna B-type domain-containing protein [Peptoniphilus sp.]